MTATELVDRIIENPSDASRLLRKREMPEGISRAFFQQVYRLFVEDHAQLRGLKKAAELIAKNGDDRALAFRSLGIIERIRGEWFASAQAFLEAGRLSDEPITQLSFQIGAIDGLARAGKVGQAVRLGHELSDQLSRIGEEGLAARAKLNVGYALMEQDRYAQAVEQLDGLPIQLRKAGFVSDSISSRLALSTCLLFGGSTGEARQQAWLASEEAEANGSQLLSNIAKGNIAYADILRGDIDLAVGSLLQLREAHEDEPVELARVNEYLGDAYFAMNLFAEAADAYQEAVSGRVIVSELHRIHLRYGLGQALTASGRDSEGLEHLRYAARNYRRLGNYPWQAATEIDLAVTELKMELPSAKRRLKQAVQTARNFANPYHLCLALIVSSENGGPVSDLDSAFALIRSRGIHQLSWRVYAERAKRSSGLQRLTNLRKMFDCIVRDQARTSSIATRIRFMVDKDEKIRFYLEELLRNPTKTRVDEAIRVVTMSRAVTLLDEVIRSRNAQLSTKVLEKLSDLRQQLNEGSLSRFNEGTRRTSGSGRNLDHLQRVWLEATHQDQSVEQRSKVDRPIQTGSMLYVTSKKDYRVLSSNGCVSLPIGEIEMEKLLAVLNFEVLAPMADPGSKPAVAMELLLHIGEAVIRPIVKGSNALGICPDGLLWRVPWIAALDASDLDNDLEIRLHPSLEGNPSTKKIKSAMVWIADHADLPRAQEEANAFLELYPDARVCRTASEVRRILSDVDVSLLHVISHSRFRSSHPMFSSLDFTDGPVLAAEIARSGLGADLVTLSGCDTARLSGANRLEPDGLVRAFLACGAGYVVGSAWPLDDEAAMKFYSAFFSTLNFNANIHESLRNARRVVRQWKGHPYYWAFPLLYAGYRS